MPQLFKQDLIIKCVKSFVEVNKNPARKFILVNCFFDIINKIYKGMSNGKILPKANLVEMKDFFSVKNFMNQLCINF